MYFLMKMFKCNRSKKSKNKITKQPLKYTEVADFIYNIKTIEDCKMASKMVDELDRPYPLLRKILCDKTFDIFLKT